MSITQAQGSKIKTQSDNAKLKAENTLKIRTYKFSLNIIGLINRLPQKKGYYSIADQLVRSATSIGANQIEAKSSSSRKEYIKYFEISLKSANETKYWLCLIRDSCPEIKDICLAYLAEVGELSKMLASSILTLKGKKSGQF